MEHREAGLIEPILRGERSEPPDVARQHARPLDRFERPIIGPGNRRLHESLPEPDPKLAGQDLDDVLRGERIRSTEEITQDRALRRGSGRGLDGAVCRRDLGQRRGRRGVRGVIGSRQDVGDGHAEVRRPVVGLAESRPRDAGELRNGGGDRRPAETRGPLVGLGERTTGEEDGGNRQLVGRQSGQVIGEEGRLFGRPRRRGDALGQLAPATHGRDGIPSPPMAHRSWFPESLTGLHVVLRRHTQANLSAFLRWYSDAEVARLTRYQDGPMRPEEIERFFTARALGPESLSLAVHVRETDRLIGTCALSQLDSDNGSALYHITIGEKDAWGHGYGTEATRLMLDHAFGTLNLHRIALSVFSFNERAIRSYLSCGFVVEGRAREAIWREGSWWDEVSMSVLKSDWEALRDGTDGEGRAERREIAAASKDSATRAAEIFGRRG